MQTGAQQPGAGDASPASQSDRVVVVVPSPTDDGSIDGAKLVDAFWAGKIRALVLAVMLGGLGLTHGLLAHRVFRAEALLVAASPAGEAASPLLGGQLGTLASLAGLGSGELSGRRAEYIALLSSNTLLRSFIERRNLMPVLFANRWDAGNKRWKETWYQSAPVLGDGVELFNKRILTVENAKEGLIRISVEWSDPQMAAEWANQLVKEVNDHVRTRTIDDARRGIEFLDLELKSASSIDVRAGIYRLHESNLNKIMLANVQQDYALRVVDSAAVPLRAVWPRKLFNVAFGIAVGGVLGFGSMLWRRRSEWWQSTSSRLTAR